MKTSPRTAFLRQAALAAYLCLGPGQVAFAQYTSGSPPPRQGDVSAQEQRERGIARCRENRGVDCDTPEGQKEWVRQERPMTDEERRAAVAARRERERLARESEKRR